MGKKTFAELSQVSGRSIEDIKADVKALAIEYQKNGDTIPLSYKKAYDKMGLYSEAAEKKMKKDSEDAKEKMSEDADKIGKSHKKSSEEAASGWESLFSVLGRGAIGGVKLFAQGVGVASSGLLALGTAAVKEYANYEQLVGGMETLFGAGGASSVQEYADTVGKSVEEVRDEFNVLMEAQNIALDNANEAYKTAGLSANDYMETVTAFAASLKASTENEVEAAKAANQAVIDMSDNANKMGTDMEAIQNAYQGFAKQNYTMLDNLKLGYGGTKEEMERLLEDAEKIHEKTTGQKIEYDISNLSDVYSAIHDVQTELGITGTTAKEASTTISGSLNAVKASCSNLLVGIADDNQDFEALIDNLVESVGIAAENILPRVETALVGIGNLVEELLPVAVEQIPEIIEGILPELLQSGINMIVTLVNGIQQSMPTIAQGAVSIILQFTTSIIGMLPQICEMGVQLLIQLALGLAQALPELIPQAVTAVLIIVQTLIDNIDLLVDAAIQLINGLAVGILQALPILIEKVPEIVISLVTALIENAPKLLEAAWEIIIMLIDGLADYSIKLVTVASQVISDLKDYFIEAIKNLDFGTIGENIIDGIWNGLSAGWDWLTDKVSGLATALYDAAKETLGIASPSKKFKYLARMCVTGFDSEMKGLMNPDVMTRNMKASLSGMTACAVGATGNTEGIGSYTQIIHVNDKIATPDELARAVRLESRYGLMKGITHGQGSENPHYTR